MYKSFKSLRLLKDQICGYQWEADYFLPYPVNRISQSREPRGNSGCENMGSRPQIGGQHLKGMVSASRALRVPTRRDVLNSLTWDIWISLFTNSLLMFQPTRPLLQNFPVTCLLPRPLRVILWGYLGCCPGLQVLKFPLNNLLTLSF